MTCKNCHHEFTGNFCNQCGQSAKVSRLNFNFLLDQMWDGIFQINRGFFFTTRELILRPGATIRGFLEGQRAQHFKPLSFLIFCTTVYVLFNYLLGHDTFLNDFLVGFNNAADEPSSELPPSKIITWITDNQVYSFLILIPFFSLASFLAFKKTGYNYVEHLVINLYIGGIQMLIYFVFSFLTYINSDLDGLPVLFGFAFNIWSYFKIFKNLTPSRKTLLLVLTYFIYFILFIAIFVSILVFAIEK